LIVVARRKGRTVAHGRIGRKFSAEVGDRLPIAIAIAISFSRWWWWCFSI
jgi:hypothetical protein